MYFKRLFINVPAVVFYIHIHKTITQRNILTQAFSLDTADYHDNNHCRTE